MSRFTAPLFNRPSPFGPERTISPPDTNVEHPRSLPYGRPPPLTLNHDMDFPGPSGLSPSENPIRRVSTLAYNGSTNSRERSSQRASRWLLLVIPPPFLNQANGNLGHTLASGPAARLTQGILMPLLPTVMIPLHLCACLSNQVYFRCTHN